MSDIHALLAMTYNLCGLMTLVGWILALLVKVQADPAREVGVHRDHVGVVTALVAMAALTIMFWPLILLDQLRVTLLRGSLVE